MCSILGDWSPAPHRRTTQVCGTKRVEKGAANALRFLQALLQTCRRSEVVR